MYDSTMGYKFQHYDHQTAILWHETRIILLTDMLYLPYHHRKKAYL